RHDRMASARGQESKREGSFDVGPNPPAGPLMQTVSPGQLMSALGPLSTFWRCLPKVRFTPDSCRGSGHGDRSKRASLTMKEAASLRRPMNAASATQGRGPQLARKSSAQTKESIPIGTHFRLSRLPGPDEAA